LQLIHVVTRASAQALDGEERTQARDQCLALVGAVCGAELVILETGVTQLRWGGADLPVARLPVNPTSLTITDAASTLRFARHPLVEAGVRSLACVPLDHASSHAGSLWVASRQAGAFDDRTREQLQRFAVVLTELLAPPDDDASHRAFVDALPLPAASRLRGALSPNAALCELAGLGGAELATVDAWFERMFSSEAASVRAMYEWDRDNGFPERRVVCLTRPDGTERLVEWAARAVGEHELWLFSDVTERVASQERFRVLFEQSSTALVVYDDAGIIDCNPAAVALLGHLAKSDLLTLAPFELSPAAQPDGELSQEKSQKMEAIARDLGSHRFDWTYRRVSGEPVQVEVTLTALTLGSRRVLLAEWHDISERALYEEALKTARDEAIKHGRAKADFLATMSHEIRTPMNGVIGMTRLLQDTRLSEQQREYVETVRACGEGLLSLINDVLDFSKLEAGKVQLEAIPFSPRDLVEEALAVIADAGQSKGLDVACFFAPTVPSMLRGDPTRLRQVLLNLLLNVVKFTATGSVQVRVAATREEAGQSVLTFTVRDTGCGIKPEGLKQLFDAFSQEDTSTTRRFGGTGLGLAISRRLLTLMGGIIDVNTGPKGSAFNVTIAFDVLETSRQGRELLGRRVLLVEDRPLVAESVGGLLRERGGEVVTARTVREATLLAGEVELVIVDHQFDQQRGRELARQLRGRGGHVGLLVPLAAPAEYAQDVDFLLPLPVRRNQLVNQVSRVLSVSSSSSGLRQVAQQPSFGARVLVAEDNPVNQRVVQGLLAKLGCEAIVVPDGAKAIEASQGGRFDVILMDCQMPEVDGFEATRRIRTGPQGKTPIIALTAGALEGDRQRCLDAGMDDYLSKPLRLEELARALAKFVKPR
jgi:PAS domain S-box-containing protein